MRHLLILVMLFATTARAGEPTDAMHTYFRGEKAGAWVFFGTGLASLGAGGTLLGVGDEAARGAAWPVMSVGLISAVAGVVLWARTDDQVADLERQIASDPAAFREAELTRMRRVNTQFLAVEIVEIVLGLSGIGMAIAGGVTDRDGLKGAGIGLAVESAVMLTLDLFAGARASTYTEALEAYAPPQSRATMLTFGGAF